MFDELVRIQNFTLDLNERSNNTFSYTTDSGDGRQVTFTTFIRNQVIV